VLAGDERAALLWVADQLCAELGHLEGDDIRAADDLTVSGGEAVSRLLSSEDEALVAGMRRGLAKIATALVSRSEDGSNKAVGAALDGAEAVMRGELLSGRAERLPALIPGFVFLVALPIVDHDGALELSGRTAELIDRFAPGSRST
jgi:hypothetical protein